MQWNGASRCEYNGKSIETDTTTRAEFANGGNHYRTNTSVRRIKSKRAGLWESQSETQVGKLTIWVRLLEIEKL